MARRRDATSPVRPTTGPPPSGTWRYAVGMFGTSLPINMFVTFMAFYYVEELGVLDASQIAGVLVPYAVIDAVDNPVYGYLSDRTRTRWGRRRPWLVLGAPAVALSLVAFFAPPTLPAIGYLLWFAVFAVLTQTADSLVNASYGALLPELFPDERRRARANALRQGLLLLGLVVGVAVTPLLADAVGFGRTALLYGVVSASVLLYTALGVREDPRRATRRLPRIGESVRAILGLPTFWGIAVAGGAYATAVALVLAGTPFFVSHALGLGSVYASVLLGTVILSSIGFLGVWAQVAQRWDAVRVWRTSLVVLAVSLVPMYVVTTLPAAIAGGMLVGVGYSGVIASADLVVARFIDVDATRSGVHREAMVIAAFGLFTRLSSLAKSLAFLGMFAIYGYVNGADPGPDPAGAARFLMLVAPFALTAVAAVAAHLVRLPRPHLPTAASDAAVGDAGPPA